MHNICKKNFNVNFDPHFTQAYILCWNKAVLSVQWALVRALWYELKWTIFALVSFTASEAMRPFNWKLSSSVLLTISSNYGLRLQKKQKLSLNWFQIQVNAWENGSWSWGHWYGGGLQFSKQDPISDCCLVASPAYQLPIPSCSFSLYTLQM